MISHYEEYGNEQVCLDQRNYLFRREAFVVIMYGNVSKDIESLKVIQCQVIEGFLLKA